MLRRSSGGIGRVGVVVLARPHVAQSPAPGKPRPPGAAVRAKRAAERGELEPAGVELAGQLVVRVEAADVGSPVGTDAERVVDADGDLRFERLPRAVGVARPDPAAPLRDAGVAVSLKTPRADVGRRLKMALVIELMALDALVQVEPVAFVGPERIDARLHQRHVLLPVVRDVRRRPAFRPVAAESSRAGSGACRDPTAPCGRRLSRAARADRR